MVINDAAIYITLQFTIGSIATSSVALVCSMLADVSLTLIAAAVMQARWRAACMMLFINVLCRPGKHGQACAGAGQCYGDRSGSQRTALAG